jgi:hypothetical protein
MLPLRWNINNITKYKMAKINVTGTDITIIKIDNSDYISLTDMAHSQMETHYY